MVALSSFRSTEPSFADLVPHAGLVDNGILLLKEGSLMAGAIVYRRAAADEATREHRGRTPDRGDQP